MDPQTQQGVNMGAHSAPQVTQVDATPTAKVTAYTLAGAAVTILISVAKSFGFELEPEVAGSLVLLLGFGAGYLKRSRPGDVDM